jgi:deoxyribodipyrimidine photo-lyase
VANGGALLVRCGAPREEIMRLARELRVDAVYANHDYEPQAIARDADVGAALASRDIAFHTTRDHVVFERDELRPKSGGFYSVFTPYKRAWLAALVPERLREHAVGPHARALARPAPSIDTTVPELRAIGFEATDLRSLGVVPGMAGGAALFADFRRRIDRYHDARDHPARIGPSYLSVHLRFGTVSIREIASYAYARSLEPGGEGASAWLSELVWREFFAQVLWHRPGVVASAFRPQYANLRFENDPAKFAAWCEGRTGYPIVDAAMRQLDATGYMHGRLRMIAASFLVKDLLVDWRWGERHFARKLLDFDLASNNGNWQWAASTGCDAQPWFRIFNPVTQSQRFDGEGRFIRRYVPEVAALDGRHIHAPWTVGADLDYPPPIVDHAAARERALALFRSA